MNQSTLVSVIIPAYNAERHLKEALESVFAQSYRPMEIIVVDDGSTDATAEIVKAFRDVFYVRQNNRGPSAARNTGIRVAKGEYLAFLDADDLWIPEKLTEQLALLDSSPEAGLAFANMRLVLAGSNAELSMFEKYNFTQNFFEHERFVIDAPSKLVWTNFIPTSTVMVRKQVLLAAGGFDEEFRKAEDWELWLRMSLRAPIVYSPKLLMFKRVHDVNTSRDAEGMNVAALQVLEKLDSENHRLLVKLGINITGALREGYRNLGYFYLRQASVAQARAAFWKSLALGVRMRALVYFLSTLLGRRFVRAMVRARG